MIDSAVYIGTEITCYRMSIVMDVIAVSVNHFCYNLFSYTVQSYYKKVKCGMI